MNFSQEDENLLEKWTTSALGQYNLPNAESITKYTITLLKKETDDPYTQCYHELESMLKPNTEDFLNNLFQVLDDGTYRLFQAENEYDEEVYDEEDERGIRRQESTSSNVHGSPTGSDGDDSYERRKRFRRRDSDASEPDQNRRTDRSPGRDHKGNSRAGGPLHSARDEHDHRDYGNNNRQRDYNNNNSNRRNNNNNNNFNSNNNQRGHRNNNQYNNNGYNNSQSSYSHQGHSGGAPPSHYPGYAPYPGQPPMAYGGYPYDPAAAGGYYGYPPNGGWQGAPPSTSGYPPYGNNPNGYYYGANYAPPAASGNGPPPAGPPPGPGAGYGYGSNAPSVPPQHTSQEAAIVDGGEQVESDSNDTNGDTGSSSATPAHTTASSSSGNAGGYNMGKYPQYGSGGAGYQSYNGQSHASRRPAQQPARESNKANRPAVKSLPENERCTLRCTSIPVHVTEEDLKAHFESFGHVVELQVSPMEGNGNNNVEDDDTEDGKKKKKQANECLVQFYSAANARRCLTSEVPVLNNRFIFIYQSHFNIIPPQDVPRPSRDILDRDAYLLSQKEIIPAASAAQAAANRKRSALNIYTSGRTNKWRRTDGFGGPGDDNKVAGDGAAMSTMRGDFREGAEEERPTNGDEAVATPSAASKAAADEMKAALMRQKQLKQQAEELLKKKEDVLINQIEKCRTLMEKLEKAPDSDSKAKNQQYLEDKIVDLQSQLRAVREQVHQQQQQQLQQQQQQQQAANGETRPPAATGAPGFFRGGYYAGGGRFPAGGRGRGNAGGRSWNAGRNAGGRFAGGGRFPRQYLTPQTSLNNPFANAAASSEGASSTNGDVAAAAGDDNGGGLSADGAAEWVGGDEQQD